MLLLCCEKFDDVRRVGRRIPHAKVDHHMLSNSWVASKHIFNSIWIHIFINFIIPTWKYDSRWSILSFTQIRNTYYGKIPRTIHDMCFLLVRTERSCFFIFVKVQVNCFCTAGNICVLWNCILLEGWHCIDVYPPLCTHDSPIVVLMWLFSLLIT